jgi:hypothetical protein
MATIRTRHTHAVVRGDISVRDRARRRSSGLSAGSAEARLEGGRATGIAPASGTKPEQRKGDGLKAGAEERELV